MVVKSYQQESKARALWSQELQERILFCGNLVDCEFFGNILVVQSATWITSFLAAGLKINLLKNLFVQTILSFWMIVVMFSFAAAETSFRAPIFASLDSQEDTRLHNMLYIALICGSELQDGTLSDAKV